MRLWQWLEENSRPAPLAGRAPLKWKSRGVSEGTRSSQPGRKTRAMGLAAAAALAAKRSMASQKMRGSVASTLPEAPQPQLSDGLH